MKSKINLRFGIIALFVLLAALSRLLPHPPNFTPIGGMALFGAAYLSKRHLAIIIPLLALWISDLILNNVVYAAYYDGFSWMGMPAVYLGFIVIALMGTKLLKKIKISNLLIASLLASTIFFLITNLASWWAMPTDIYSKDAIGLLTAFTAAIPFFFNTIAGDLFFTAVLFGGYELVKHRFPAFA